MSHNHDHSDDLDLSILEQMGYEERDLKIDKTGKLGVGLFGFTLAMFGAAFVVIWLMAPQLSGRPATESGFRTLPGKDFPLLQSNATAHRDMIKLREQEKERVHGYGWMDENESTAHIPIDRAMDMVLEEGLPVKAGARKMKEPAPDPVLSEPADDHGGSVHGTPETPVENHQPEENSARTPIVPSVSGAGGEGGH